MLLFLIRETLSDQSAYAVIPADIGLVMCRFLCAIFLHITRAGELNQGLNFMKYALNHPWKFNNWFNAFFIGFLQMIVLISVEAVNLGILLSNQTIIDTIMNFLALVIISDFDDYFFFTVSNEKPSLAITHGEVEVDDIKVGLDQLTLIEVTTSDLARFKIEGNLLKTPLKDFYKQDDKEQDESREIEHTTTIEELAGLTQPNINIGNLDSNTQRSGVISN